MTAEPAARAAFGRRLAWHARLALRASRFGVAAGLAGGFLLHLVLPVRGFWLAGAVALGAAVMGLACVALGGQRPLPSGLEVGPSLEKVAGADQVAHGLARAALVLASFTLGLWLGGLAGSRF
jgi:hypothetical protein